MKVIFTILLFSFAGFCAFPQSQYVQVGNKLEGRNFYGASHQGFSVGLSGDGKTAIVGGNEDNVSYGAAWIYTFNGNNFVQYKSKIAVSWADHANNGYSVGLSYDGHTAIIGGANFYGGYGVALTYRFDGSDFVQIGSPLGSGMIGAARFGYSSSISGDGQTVLIGGPGDNADQGAAWIYTYDGSNFINVDKLIASDGQGSPRQGSAVSLSADGKSAIVGGPADNSDKGAVWVYTFNGSNYVQFGSKLVIPGVAISSKQGTSVSVSGDGKTILAGGYYDALGRQAAWIYTFDGSSFVQAGNMLEGSDVESGFIQQGIAVSMSADGKTALLGSWGDGLGQGAAWIFTFNGSSFEQCGHKLVGTGVVDGPANQGNAVSLSADGKLALIGGQNDSTGSGAAWLFGDPKRNLAINNITASNAFCEGTDVTLSVEAVGISLEYQWFRNNLPIAEAKASDLILHHLNGVSEGSYFCVVSNFIGSVTSSGVNVVLLPAPTITGFIAPEVVCIRSPVIITASGADVFTLSDGLRPGIQFIPTISGVYTLTGTTNGCFSTVLLNVTVVNIVITISGNHSVCLGSSGTLAASGANQYQWSTGSTDQVITITPVSATRYTVAGIGMNGCSASGTVLITVTSLPVVSLDLSPMGLLCNTVGSVALSGGKPAGGTYWYEGVSANPLDISKGGNYPVMYEYKDQESCVNTALDTLSVKVCLTICELPDPPCSCTNTCPPPFRIYNAITPNGDGYNDTWVIDSLFEDYRLSILDKWGNVLHHEVPYRNNWNGKSNGKELPDGIYYYMLEAMDEKKRFSGIISVIR